MIMVFGYDSSSCSRVWAIEALKLRSPEFYMWSWRGSLSYDVVREVTIGMDSAETADALTGVDLGHDVLQLTLT